MIPDARLNLFGILYLKISISRPHSPCVTRPAPICFLVWVTNTCQPLQLFGELRKLEMYGVHMDGDDEPWPTMRASRDNCHMFSAHAGI